MHSLPSRKIPFPFLKSVVSCCSRPYCSGALSLFILSHAKQSGASLRAKDGAGQPCRPFRIINVRACAHRLTNHGRGGASRFWCLVNFGLRPSLTPRVLARSRPSLHPVFQRRRSSGMENPVNGSFW
jgi:hypothetical protein